MSYETLVELVGYLGSAFVISSLAQKSILRLRLIGLAGSATFFVYSILIDAYPIAIVNVVAAGIHLYYLVKLTRRAYTVFDTLQVRHDSAYLNRFLEFHSDDIGRYQPEFRRELGEHMSVFFVLRDMVPAGLLVFRQDEGDIKIVLDYAIPEYRDFKLGRYVFSEKSRIFPTGTTLWSFATSPQHAKYLERMGFVPKLNDRFELTLRS